MEDNLKELQADLEKMYKLFYDKYYRRNEKKITMSISDVIAQIVDLEIRIESFCNQ